MQARCLTDKDPLPLPVILETISRDPALTQLCMQTRRIHAAHRILTRSLAQHFPENAICFFAVSHSTPKKITVITQDAINANALRYRQQTLLNAFRQHQDFCQIEQIKVKIVLPSPTVRTKKKRIVPSLSVSTRALLQQTSLSVKHPALQRALGRLASSIAEPTKN